PGGNIALTAEVLRVGMRSRDLPGECGSRGTRANFFTRCWTGRETLAVASSFLGYNFGGHPVFRRTRLRHHGGMCRKLGRVSAVQAVRGGRAIGTPAVAREARHLRACDSRRVSDERPRRGRRHVARSSREGAGESSAL